MSKVKGYEEERREFIAKMREVASSLKYELEDNESDPDYEVKLKSGRKEFVIELIGYRGEWQLKISKLYPEPFDGNLDFRKPPVSITVEYERTADQIWEDILLRLLKGYNREVIEAVAADDIRKRAHERMRSTIKSIADMLNGEPVYSDDGYQGEFIHREFYGFDAITTCATDKVQVELQLTESEAIELIRFLKEM